MNCNKDDGGIDTTTTNSSDGQHHHHMSKLANGINKIVVKCNEEAQNNNMPTLRRKNTIGSTGSLNSTGSNSGMMMSSTSPSINFAASSNNNASVGASLSYAKAVASSTPMNDTDDCDKSQSSISGASLERRSSFRSRAGKAYSPRWVDQKHNYQHDNLQQHHNTQGYDTDDKSSQIKRKSGEMFHSHHHDSASQASFGGGGDSHDEGYLSQHSSTGYDHSYHPALSYAASVKSDIATVCSGSVVEDIDMEMGSVASDGKKPPPQHQQPKDDIPKPKGVEFASNILNPLNDMGPPQALCSALLLAANAACQPNSNSLGFEQQSDVEAHVDTDDCCDRSIDAESEVSTLHSQEDDASHKDCNLDESERIRPDGGMKSDSQHSLNLPLQRFQQGQVDLSHLTDNPNFPPLQHAEERADDWSNSRSHSRSPSRSPSPSSTKSKCSRSRSRSPSAICQQANRPSWYNRERQPQPPQAANADMEDADTEEPKYRVDFSSKTE